MPLKQKRVPRTTTNRQPYSLVMKNPVNKGNTFVASLAGQTYGYRKRSRLLGGDWTARFNVSGSEEQLKKFFLTKMAHHIEQNVGSIKVWEGFIFEMDYSAHGITRRISLVNVRNAVRARYIDQNDAEQLTSWYTDAASIATYGRIEEIIYLDGVITATAEAEAQTHLKKSAWPVPEVVSLKDNQDLKLEVTCVGYVYTMNNKYVTAGDGTNKNLSVFLADIIDTDCDFVTKASIVTNTTQVRTTFETDMRAWDAIVALTEIGDATQPFIVQVFNGRRAVYKALNPSPTMFWRGTSLHNTVGSNAEIDRWSVRPGIMRDMTWAREVASISEFLLDSRDSIIFEIEASTQYKVPLLKTDKYDDSDFMTALAKELRDDDTRTVGDFRTRGTPFL